jgi:hypothetical protein
MEQQESWYLSETETVLEVIFLSLLTATMSIGLQVCHFWRCSPFRWGAIPTLILTLTLSTEPNPNTLTLT